MDTRATYVIPREFIGQCFGDGNFQEGVPVKDVIRIQSSEHTQLLKYRKHETNKLETLTPEQVATTKQIMFSEGPLLNCRSLLFDNSMNLLAFTPPKSVNVDSMDTTSETMVYEQFVEGTMMTVFYHPVLKTWEMATRSIIGGRNQFFKDTPQTQQNGSMTFRKMFLDAMTDVKLEFEMLPQEYSYTFVVQHPTNRVVVPFHKTALYLVGMYSIDNSDDSVYRVKEVDLSTCQEEFMKRVKTPTRYEGTFEDLREKYASETSEYSIVGLIMRDGERRAKLRNPVYERIRRLRGNQPKQQFQYLTLRKEGRIREFLEHYPEMRKSCSIWRSQIHGFTTQLHQYYMNVFVLHKTPIQDVPFEFRPHVIALHEKYIHELKSKNEKVHKGVVIAYVNALPVPRLMFCLNASIRKQHMEYKKSKKEAQEQQQEE